MDNLPTAYIQQAVISDSTPHSYTSNILPNVQVSQQVQHIQGLRGRNIQQARHQPKRVFMFIKHAVLCPALHGTIIIRLRFRLEMLRGGCLRGLIGRSMELGTSSGFPCPSWSPTAAQRTHWPQPPRKQNLHPMHRGSSTRRGGFGAVRAKPGRYVLCGG